jgi:hypothetical protein
LWNTGHGISDKLNLLEECITKEEVQGSHSSDMNTHNITIIIQGVRCSSGTVQQKIRYINNP